MVYIFSGFYLCGIIGFFIGLIDGACSIGSTGDTINLIKNIIRGLIGGAIIGGIAGIISGVFIYAISQL